MLSIHTMSASLGKVADAVNYFLKEAEYYGNGKGTWFGDGAERLNLKGEVNKEDFQQLLEGKIPGGPDLARNTQKGKEHRLGYDCCFSAPKSFSILSQVGALISSHLLSLIHI